MKICFRCKKAIEDNSNYYTFTEMNKGKVMSTDYAHRECWDKFLENVGSVTEAKGIIHGLKNKLIEMEVLPPEQVVIS